MAEYEVASEDSGWEAGEPLEGHFEVPDFVEVLRSELNTVREAISEVNAKLYPAVHSHAMVYGAVDAVVQIQNQQALDALYKEENRLMEALRAVEWIIVPAMEPPHNLSQSKAREMLHHGEIHGRPLTKAQRGLFGIIASGKTPRRAK